QRAMVIAVILLFFFRPVISESFFLMPQIGFQIVIFLVWIIGLSYSRDRGTANYPGIPSGMDTAAITFICLQGAGFFYSVNRQASLDQILYWSALYGMFRITAGLPHARRVTTMLVAAISTAATLVIGYAVYQYYYGFPAMREFVAMHPEYGIASPEFLRRMYSDLVFSTFLYPPTLAGYMAVLFLFLFGAGEYYRRTRADRGFPPWPIFLYAIMFSVIPVIILTKSKGGWIAFICGLAGLSLILERNKRRNAGIAVGLSILIVSLVLLFFSKKFRLPSLENFMASFAVRKEYWTAALEMIRQKPCFGFGPGTFSSIYPHFKTPLGEETVAAHNSFLQLGAETGIVGLVVFLWFWGLFFVHGYRLIRQDSTPRRFLLSGIYAAIIAFFVHNLVDFSFSVQQTAVTVFGLAGFFFYLCPDTRGVESPPVRTTGKRTAAVALLILAVCLSSAQYAAKYFYLQAQTAAAQKNFEKAYRLAGYSAGFAPLAAEYRFHLGLIQEARACDKSISPEERDELLRRAIGYYRRAVAGNAYAPVFYERLGNALLAVPGPRACAEAGENFRKAVEAYPANPYYHEQLARFYDIMKQPDKAEQARRSAAECRRYYFRGTR
ncbi:MAG: O-antigen ligase family protein, partial [Candidatus Omnitrophica bacterium]|nr:O-antigen ligase family protein [Candidatus Omnitrophota bacterium]